MRQLCSFQYFKSKYLLTKNKDLKQKVRWRDKDRKLSTQREENIESVFQILNFV